MFPFGFGEASVRLTDFFFSNTSIPYMLQSNLRYYWWVLGIGGIFSTLYTCWPKLKASAKLNGRDVVINVEIGDIFTLEGAIIIGSNTTFDTRIDDGLISTNSVQGKFTQKYYNSTNQLDKDLSAGLRGMKSTKLEGKRKGKDKKYPIGSIISVNPKNRKAYFAAIADLNEHGVASGTFEDLKQSLAQLWEYMGEQGSKDQPLLIPVLGSGFSRISEPRERIIQEIIKSFIAACSEKTFCNSLTIVLNEKDVRDYHIDFKVISEYLHHVCKYTEFSVNSDARVGMPIEE